jgi:hypothetical protein
MSFADLSGGQRWNFEASPELPLLQRLQALGDFLLADDSLLD